MLLVVAARNGVLFLVGWELMSLASFFLVMFEDEKESVRRAGWIYLVAMHLGTAFLLAMFLLLGQHAGVARFRPAFGADAGMAGVVFLLAVIGFGTKAGFMPLHVWLPEAHPAAPSHVSAVMSGVMIKTGIYGLLRMLTLLGPPPAWWGWTLVAIGVVSGILGVLFALAQHDLKRLLAYHSVENIGIIALGLGVGLLGISYGNPAMAVLGLAGGLLHVVNHAVFKSLLFLGAGAVLHATGTRRDRPAGRTAEAHAGHRRDVPGRRGGHLRAAAAERLRQRVSDLPRRRCRARQPGRSGAGVAVDGRAGRRRAGADRRLAAACFTKAFGIVFLGEPRSDEAAARARSRPRRCDGRWSCWPACAC